METAVLLLLFYCCFSCFFLYFLCSPCCCRSLHRFDWLLAARCSGFHFEKKILSVRTWVPVSEIFPVKD